MRQFCEELEKLAGLETKARSGVHRDHYQEERVELPQELLDQIQVKKIGVQDGYEIWLVNGSLVRQPDIDIDFIGAGNPARYGYVPHKRIWIEQSTPAYDLVPYLIHELAECRAMIEHGLSYEKAHRLANQHEATWRRQHPLR